MDRLNKSSTFKICCLSISYCVTFQNTFLSHLCYRGSQNQLCSRHVSIHADINSPNPTSNMLEDYFKGSKCLPLCHYLTLWVRMVRIGWDISAGQQLIICCWNENEQHIHGNCSHSSLTALQLIRRLLQRPPNTNRLRSSLNVFNLEGESVSVFSKLILSVHSCRILEKSVEQDIQRILTWRQSQQMRAFTCSPRFITAATTGSLCMPWGI